MFLKQDDFRWYRDIALNSSKPCSRNVILFNSSLRVSDLAPPNVLVGSKYTQDLIPFVLINLFQWIMSIYAKCFSIYNSDGCFLKYI